MRSRSIVPAFVGPCCRPLRRQAVARHEDNRVAAVPRTQPTAHSCLARRSQSALPLSLEHDLREAMRNRNLMYAEVVATWMGASWKMFPYRVDSVSRLPENSLGNGKSSFTGPPSGTAVGNGGDFPAASSASARPTLPLLHTLHSKPSMTCTLSENSSPAVPIEENSVASVQPVCRQARGMRARSVPTLYVCGGGFDGGTSRAGARLGCSATQTATWPGVCSTGGHERTLRHQAGGNQSSSGGSTFYQLNA